MRYSKLISKKEFQTYFQSPAAYIVMVVFLLITGWFFSSPLFLNNQADMRSLFGIIPIIYLFFIPAITMGLVAKERSSGTLELLTTLPVNDAEIIHGKFLSALGLIAVTMLFTLIHLFTIIILGTELDYGPIFTGYLGLLLLGGVYTSVGIFTSALTENQIVAFIISFLIVFFLFILEYTLMIIPSGVAGFFQYISVGYHLSNLTRGVIDTRNIIYFLSLIVFFLRLAVVAMESRKWK
ncbi:MAG: ABC transporter permease subunit [Candidatus Cloacimonetes bacterium]|nr:ABC transporter permease subunit [Candidatus Cloacimonadota bacterium]